MKRIVSAWIISMFLGLLPVMGETSSPDNLVFNKAEARGQIYVGIEQLVFIEVTNTGTENYHNWWEIGQYTDGTFTPVGSFFMPVEIQAGETKEFAKGILMNEPGDIELSVFDISAQNPLYTFTVHVDALPKVKGSIEINTQTDDDGTSFVYSDFKTASIKGKVTLTNEDEISLNNESYNAFLVVYISPYIGIEQTLSIPLPREIKSGETFSKDFSFGDSGSPTVGQEYVVHLMFAHKDLATSAPFTFKISTGTYWIANGKQRPLTVSDANTLMVPQEALAVDLRGLYYMNKTFTIDVSNANPNCIYYLNFIDNVPSGFQSENNIIRGGEAKTLVIDSNYDFFCPIKFLAKSALFNYTPISESMGPPSPVMSRKFSGFFMLPFSVQQAWMTGTNKSDPDNPFYNDNFKMARFYGYDNDVLHFEALDGRIFLSDSESYLIYDMKPSAVVFYGEDSWIYPQSIMETTHNGFRSQGATTKAIPAAGSYRWNCDKTGFYLNDEIWIRPFASWIGKWDNQNSQFEDLGLDVLPYYIKEPTHTAIKDFRKNEDTSRQLPVCTLSGQQVGMATNINGQIRTEGLKPGLYVVGGRKIIVK